MHSQSCGEWTPQDSAQLCTRYTQSGRQFSSSSLLYCHPEHLILYTIWQYKESTSHSFFEKHLCNVHAIWGYFFNKRNLFINIQRLTFHFISTISNVIHVFGHIFFCKGMPLLFTLQMNCQTCSHIFCHIRAQSITFGFTFAKSAVRQCDMKGIFIELCWRQLRVQPFDPCHRRLRMQEDNGLLVALFLIFNFFK